MWESWSCLSGLRASPGILNVGELIMYVRSESLTRNIKCGRVDHVYQVTEPSPGILNVGELIMSIRSQSLTTDVKCGRVDHVYQVREPHQGYWMWESWSCLSGLRASPGMLNVGELIMSIRSEILTRNIKCGRVDHVYQVREPHQGYWMWESWSCLSGHRAHQGY